MILLADDRVALRQALVKGRMSETITGRGLEIADAALESGQDGQSAPIPAKLVTKPGGYFALQLDPGRDMPDLAGGGAVTLTMHLILSGRDPVEVARVVHPADLAVADHEVTAAGRTVTVKTVAGAPLDFSTALPPAAVALAGTLLRDHDPSDPITGVEVRADGGAPAVTDAGGRFFIAALPVAEIVTLTLREGADETSVPFRPDYALRINTITLSLDS